MRGFGIAVLCVVLSAAGLRSAVADPLDAVLRKEIARHGITPIVPDEDPPAPVFELGKALFYDKILSGNKDTSCATCHHDFHRTGDDLSLSLGTRASGLGPTRVIGARSEFVPRNATDLFNRGLKEWQTQFWDGRVEKLPDGSFRNPARGALPKGFANVLEIQAMFPVTSRDEMRGEIGDDDVNGDNNELADVHDANPVGMWAALMVRLKAIPGYRELFAKAYPDVPAEQLGFEHAAKAIAGYEAKAFRFLDAPWDQYVGGNDAALDQPAKRGAVLFFGKARCADCHGHNLLTDQQYHNILVPHLGPGREPYEPFDKGRWAVTGNLSDLHAYRTPPLRNVTVTGPWMHNGAFTSLEAAVRHHADPVRSFLEYDRSQLFQVELRPTVMNSLSDLREQLASLSFRVLLVPKLSDAEVADLLAFLKALESPSLSRLDTNKPDTVPSGLPVDGTKLPARK